MMRPESIAAMRSVQAAAQQLTLVCTEVVGAVAMEVAMPTVSVLGEPLPRELRRRLRAIDKGGKAK